MQNPQTETTDEAAGRAYLYAVVISTCFMVLVHNWILGAIGGVVYAVALYRIFKPDPSKMGILLRPWKCLGLGIAGIGGFLLLSAVLGGIPKNLPYICMLLSAIFTWTAIGLWHAARVAAKR